MNNAEIVVDKKAFDAQFLHRLSTGYPQVIHMALDIDGYAVWKRIWRAVEELEGTVPKSGEAIQ